MSDDSDPLEGELDGGGIGRLISIGGSWDGGTDCELIIGLNELLKELAYNCWAKVSLLPACDGFRRVCRGTASSGSGI